MKQKKLALAVPRSKTLRKRKTVAEMLNGKSLSLWRQYTIKPMTRQGNIMSSGDDND